MRLRRRDFLSSAIALATLAKPALGAEREVIEARVELALQRLYRDVPGAAELRDRAVGLLVMPAVVKGGFLLGGTYGEGALRLAEDGFQETAGYYSVAGVSLGLQAGVQETSHVLFFLTDRSLERFRTSDGWEIGADAEATFPDTTANIGLTSTEFRKPIVALVFAGSGLLVGASLEGAKYSRIVR
ncbi:MAG: YSC84-related protein [Paracoccaceae bacterium]